MKSVWMPKFAASAAPAGPKQLGLGGCRGASDLAVGGHHLGREHVVACGADLAGVEPEPATEQEPTHADRGTAAVGNHHAVGGERGINVTVSRARLDVHTARGINGDSLHSLETDHEAAAGRIAGVAMSTAARDRPDVGVAGEPQRSLNIRRVGREHHAERARRGVTLVIGRRDRVVTGVRGQHELPPQRSGQHTPLPLGGAGAAPARGQGRDFAVQKNRESGQGRGPSRRDQK